jgi:hypothetical protein
MFKSLITDTVTDVVECVANVTEAHGADRTPVSRQKTIYSLIMYQLIELLLYWQVATNYFATIARLVLESQMLLIPERSGVATVRGARSKPQVLAPLLAGVGSLPFLPITFLRCPSSIPVPGSPSFPCEWGPLPSLISLSSFLPYPSPYLPCPICPLVLPPCGLPLLFKWGSGGTTGKMLSSTMLYVERHSLTIANLLYFRYLIVKVQD